MIIFFVFIGAHRQRRGQTLCPSLQSVPLSLLVDPRYSRLFKQVYTDKSNVVNRAEFCVNLPEFVIPPKTGVFSHKESHTFLVPVLSHPSLHTGGRHDTPLPMPAER